MKKKKALAKGDRVRVYHGWKRITGTVDGIQWTYGQGGVRVDHPDLIHVVEDGFYSVHVESPFHVNQIRKLN